MQRIADAAKSRLGCGYVYGATGWVCSLSRRQTQANQYPEYADTILSTCAKWDGKECYDCAQLTRYAAKAAGVSLVSGATSQWKSGVWMDKGEIATMPDVAGIILYRQKGDVMQHTGVYVGNGRVVDSRGSSYGVIESDLTSYPWTHWARVNINQNENSGGAKTVIRAATVTKISGATGSTVNLRSSASSGANVLCTVPFGSTVEIIEESGGWSRLAFNGNDGYMMTKFLPADGGASAGVTSDGDDTVTVSRAELRTAYDTIGRMLGV